MKVSYNWLKLMVDLPDDIQALCDKLDMTGTGVEGVEKISAGFEGVVVGQVLTKEHHPDADTLWVTTIDVGTRNLDEEGNPQPLQIVCGAQNFEVGDKVPVAMIGALLPDGTKIKKSKLRGIVSEGMNCSGRELNLFEDVDGLLLLPTESPVGVGVDDLFGHSNYILDLEITPNRPDCMSMLGLARECGAIYDTNVRHTPRRLIEPGQMPWAEQAATNDEDVNDFIRVTIEAAELCSRYTARLIRDVKIGSSPEIVLMHLGTCGVRSINNIVDATNYVMFELGQPLHAFDYDKLAKDSDGRVHIVVRAAHEGETLTTLDGVERILTSDMTVIADGAAGGEGGCPIALAGVMGGLDTEVTEDTVNILLESAAFSAAHTSRTSRNLQLFSESSLRYERGIDSSACAEWSAAAAVMMSEYAHGTVVGGVVDEYPLPPVRSIIAFRPQRFSEFVGAQIPRADAIHILELLGCEIRQLNSAVLDTFKDFTQSLMAVLDDVERNPNERPFMVIAPTFRPDLTREIDLYEEVLRIWGMDRVTPTMPGGRGRIGGRTPEQIRVDLIGSTLRASGLNETMTYTFCPADDQDRMGAVTTPHTEAVELINPMSFEQNVLRRSLMPGLLRSVSYNQSHGVAQVHLYETGRVFFAAEGHKKPREVKRVAGILAGAWNEPTWNEPTRPLDFFDAKGIVENLARELAVPKLTCKEAACDALPWLQPGRAAEVFSGGVRLGWIGEIHPRVCAAFDVKPAVAAFELEMEALLTVSEEMRPYVDVPVYPAVEIDLALVVDTSMPAKRVEQIIISAAGNLLDSVNLFDVYEDSARLGQGKKSLAFSLAYRAKDRTLTSEEVERQHTKLVDKVIKATGGSLRS